MKEFSDEFLKEIIKQKSDEFEPQDNLQVEWKNISKKLPRDRYVGIYYSLTALLGVLLLFTLTNIEVSRTENVSIKSPAALSQIADQITTKKNTKIETNTKENQNQRRTTNENQRNNSKFYTISKPAKIEIAPSSLQLEETSGVQQKANTSHSVSEKIKLEIKTEEAFTIKNDSTHKKEPLSPEDRPVDPKIWSLHGGIFYNINRFVPNENDPIFIKSFEQSGNLFANRIGVKLTLESPTIKTLVG